MWANMRRAQHARRAVGGWRCPLAARSALAPPVPISARACEPSQAQQHGRRNRGAHRVWQELRAVSEGGCGAPLARPGAAGGARGAAICGRASVPAARSSPGPPAAPTRRPRLRRPHPRPRRLVKRCQKPDRVRAVAWGQRGAAPAPHQAPGRGRRCVSACDGACKPAAAAGGGREQAAGANGRPADQHCDRCQCRQQAGSAEPSSSRSRSSSSQISRAAAAAAAATRLTAASANACRLPLRCCAARRRSSARWRG